MKKISMRIVVGAGISLSLATHESQAYKAQDASDLLGSGSLTSSTTALLKEELKETDFDLFLQTPKDLLKLENKETTVDVLGDGSPSPLQQFVLIQNDPLNEKGLLRPEFQEDLEKAGLSKQDFYAHFEVTGRAAEEAIPAEWLQVKDFPVSPQMAAAQAVGGIAKDLLFQYAGLAVTRSAANYVIANHGDALAGKLASMVVAVKPYIPYFKTEATPQVKESFLQRAWNTTSSAFKTSAESFERMTVKAEIMRRLGPVADQAVYVAHTVGKGIQKAASLAWNKASSWVSSWGKKK